ncbi:MAG: MbcA/ParS/Xre antitoxin family protein [Burkholderiales bacterium]|jgi:hypothetical protein|nr:MbcA/ParS/Xre antitoxin family protein [Burkholderiales bacterium]
MGATEPRKRLSEEEVALCSRYESVRLEATRLLGEGAARYLWTRNFALGGATPVELLADDDGVQAVLSELSAQADGGPL